jgi:Zn-dependent protease/predicted transcriptional regulator
MNMPAPDISRSPTRAASTLPGFRLGRISGVELVADFSLLFIVILIAFNLALAVLPAWHPGWPPALRWGVALLAALMFIASIAAHELAHALVAKHYKLPVRRITLFLFGGIAHLEREPDSPRAEFWTAIVGPLLSIAIGVVSVMLGGLLVGNMARLENEPMNAIQHASPLATILLWLGPINVMLGLFNMVPGFPLDGGRVLRAALWWITKDLRKATRIASFTGQVFAWFLMGFGVLMMLGRSVPFFGTGFAAGLWLILIGWFLNNAARASYQQLMIRQTFADVPLRDVMRSNVISVPPNLTVSDLVRDYIVGNDQRSFPVVQDGVLLGQVHPDDLRDLPRIHWNDTPVSRIMVPANRLRVMKPEDDAMDALQELAQQDPIPVVDHSHLVGIARRDDLMRWLAWNSQRTSPRPA